MVCSTAADLTKSQDVRRVIQETVKQFGTVHILVTNAGNVGRLAPFEKLADEEWADIFNLNVLSTLGVTQAVSPCSKSKSGRIINIASESGIQPGPVMPHYGRCEECSAMGDQNAGALPAGERLLVLLLDDLQRSFSDGAEI